MAKSRVAVPPWDLTALFNAADPRARLPERHLWLIRLLEWLRHAPVDPGEAKVAAKATPRPVLRLKHLLGVLDRHPEHALRVRELLRRFWVEVDSAALLADFGFAPRMHLWGELGRRVHARLLPLTPATTDLGELFELLFPEGSDDAAWLRAIDDATLGRLQTLIAPTLPAEGGGRQPFLDAIMFLTSAVRSAGFAPALRQRMSPALLAQTPFRRLSKVAEQVTDSAEALVDDVAAVDASGDGPGAASGDDPGAGTGASAGSIAGSDHVSRNRPASPADTRLRQEALHLRDLLEACRRCADSVHEHLEAHGVSVDVMFELDQLRERTYRIDALLTCVVSREPARDIVGLLADLVRTAGERRSIRALFARHYSMLARKVAERSAETGSHYITRTRAEYRSMVLAALGGGSVLAATTFAKFGVIALGLSPFWGGFWAGINYAGSFLVVQAMHWTVATKQPAMTAPALAGKLADVSSNDAVESFVDEVAHLIRSQVAGIFGNLAAVVPWVLAVQFATRYAFGAPLIGADDARYVLDSLSLLGPTALFAAFTGVLLFASSLIAGWAENWFVWHRLDSAIAWNPRIVNRLGAARAQRWAAYWRRHVSGFASNISLGLMLGIVPVLGVFFGLPVEVRHVTLSTGQVAAAVGALGIGVLRESAFWWCVAGIVVTGLLNLTVSFLLAFRLALRSRGIRLADRSRIYQAIRARLWHSPASFMVPPAEAAQVMAVRP